MIYRENAIYLFDNNWKKPSYKIWALSVQNVGEIIDPVNYRKRPHKKANGNFGLIENRYSPVVHFSKKLWSFYKENFVNVDHSSTVDFYYVSVEALDTTDGSCTRKKHE